MVEEFRVVQQWDNWTLYCVGDGGYILCRSDPRTQNKYIRIDFTATDDAAALNETTDWVRIINKPKQYLAYCELMTTINNQKNEEP